MTDLANLGLAVDTSQIEAANKSLSNFAQSGKNAQVSADVLVASAVRLGISVEEVQRRLAAANDNMAANTDQAIKLADATKMASAANDNFANSMKTVGAESTNAGRGFLATIEHALTLVGHLKLLAVAAYAISPAFRGVVNTGIKAFLTEIVPIAGFATSALKAIGSALSPLVSVFASIGTPLLAAVGAFEVLSSIWRNGAALLDKYANSLRALYLEDTVQNLQKLTKNQGDAGDIISAEQIERATELGMRLQDAGFIIERFLKTSVIDFTNLSLKLQSVWVKFVEVVAQGVQLINSLPLAKIAEIAARSTPVVNSALTAATLASSFSPETSKDEENSRSLKAASDRLSAIMGVAALARESTDKLKNAVGDLNQEYDIGSSFIARFSDAIKKLSEGAEKQVDTWDRVVKSIERHTAAMTANAASAGKDIAFQEQLRVETQLLNSTKGGLNAVTDEQIDKFTELRTEMSAEQALVEAGIKFNKDYADSFLRISKEAGEARQALAQANYEISHTKALQADQISTKALTAYSPTAKGDIAEQQKRLELQDELNKKIATQEQVDERAASARKLAIDTEIKQLTEAARARALSAQQAVESEQKSIDAIGKSVGERYKIIAVEQARQQLESDASARHTTINQKELAALTAQIEKTAALKQQEAELSAQRDANFHSQTMFLSDAEKQAASLMRQLYGDEWQAHMDDALAKQVQFNARLEEAYKSIQGMATTFAQTFVQGLLNGKSVMDSLTASAKNFGKSLTDAGISNIIKDPTSIVGYVEAGIGIITQWVTGASEQRKKAEEELQKAKAEWAAMADKVKDFNRAAAGINLGPLTTALVQLRSTYEELAQAANKAKDFAAVKSLQDTFNAGVNRTITEFVNGSSVTGELAKSLKGVSEEGNGLIDILRQYGVLTSDVTDMITGAIQRQQQALRDRAEQELLVDIRNNSGVGYLNTISDAIAKFNDLTAQGVNSGVTSAWLYSTAQGAINAAKLQGDAYKELTALYPQLIGVTHEFIDTQALAAKAAADATQKLSLQLRLLTATTDSSTMAGALALFDAKAKQERDAAIAAGIALDNLAILDQALSAERLNVIKSFSDKAIEEEKRIAEARLAQMQRIQEYLDGLRAGSGSTASPADRLSAAQSQYQRQLDLARSGDSSAIDSITRYAEDFRTAARDYYGSTTGYQDIYSKIQSDLAGIMAVLGAGMTGPMMGGTTVPGGTTINPATGGSANTNSWAELKAENAALRTELIATKQMIKDTGELIKNTLLAINAEQGPNIKRTADAVVDIKSQRLLATA